MSKLKGKSTRFSSPFDASIRKTERTANQKVVEWMNRIIREQSLPIGFAEQETTGSDRKQPDIVIYKSPQSNDALCVIELKPPYHDAFNIEELKEPARKKATRRKAKYFGTSNFKKLVWYKTEEVNKMVDETAQIANIYELSTIEDLNAIEEPRFKNSIVKNIEIFLRDLAEVYTGKRPEPLLAIDQLLLSKLREKNDRLSGYYKTIIRDSFHKDKKFRKNLIKWFFEQQWNFVRQDTDFEKAARQTAYLLINKILFYQALRTKQSSLVALNIPDDLTAGGQLQKQLQEVYFGYVRERIDYETVFSTDFIDQIAFPDSKEVVSEIKDVVNIVTQYNFAQLGYEVIGQIFERLIPQEERHNLGQYFTNADVVDLILKFCLNHEDDKILDPACGAGTFLVRGYQHKKLLNLRLSHEEILKGLWGVDIAKFPAHLATINLAIKGLGVDKNYPCIAQEDFFNLSVYKTGLELPEGWRKIIVYQLSGEKKEIAYPRWFDCIVGNPPYTRQEEIAEITQKSDYKKELVHKAIYYGNQKLAEISKRAGIYAYFFVHGTKLLKNGGRFGFIVSNAWLDVDYGKGLQELFLTHYKIVAIIESKVERWFEDADINTCIIILEKCNDKKLRDNNLVRFAYLKKPLRHFIPSAQKTLEKEKERLDAIEKLRKTILFHNDFYENEELRIYPKKQGELWEEGLDAESQKYTGAKWGKYLRAPQVFFKILKKGKDKFVPLVKIADVRRGYIPWPYADYLFDVDKVRETRVEDNHLIRVFHSTTDSNRILLDSPSLFRTKMLLVEKPEKELKKTNVLKYIRRVEAKSSKKPGWYNLGSRKPYPIIWLRTPYNRHIVYLNQINLGVIDHVEVESTEPEKLCLLLNSTLYALLRELFGRAALGQGTLKTEVMDVKKFPAFPKALLQKVKTKNISAILSRPIGSIFEEIGATSASEVSLDAVKPDRRELDKIIMGEILGLTDDEQLEVYRAVIDLVKSRIEKAKSLGNRKKTKEGIDIDAFVETVLSSIGEPTLGKFYEENILTQKPLRTKRLPEGSGKVKVEELLQGWRLYSGKKYVECDCEAEARYLKAFIGTGLNKVKIPPENVLLRILPELEKLRSKIDSVVDSYLESIISAKTRNLLQHHIWAKVLD